MDARSTSAVCKTDPQRQCALHCYRFTIQIRRQMPRIRKCDAAIRSIAQCQAGSMSVASPCQRRFSASKTNSRSPFSSTVIRIYPTQPAEQTKRSPPSVSESLVGIKAAAPRWYT
jgi:hypothetical protein